MIFRINEDICIYCGRCAADCPAEVIKIDGKKKTAAISEAGCIGCSHCAMICPAGAIEAGGLKAAAYPENFKTAGFSIDEADHLILSKRSIRTYSREELTTDEIDAVMRAGSLTATATNSRQVEALLFQGKGREKLGRFVATIILRVLRLVNNPVGRAVVKLGNNRKYADRKLLSNFISEMEALLRGESDILFFNAPAVVILTYRNEGRMFGRTDCALAGENMMLAAHARGIGSCMVGFAEAALFSRGLRKKAGIPGDRRIGLIFTLGKTDLSYRRYPIREDGAFFRQGTI